MELTINLKKMMAWTLTLVIVATLMPVITPAADGTEGNPYIITTPEELAAIGGEESEGKFYALGNNIDLTEEWVPIANFRRTFDGRRHSGAD